MNETKATERMVDVREGGQAEPSGVDLHGNNPDQGQTGVKENVETQNAELPTLSDVWPPEKEMRDVRVLHPVQSTLPKRTMPRDRRNYFKMGGQK